MAAVAFGDMIIHCAIRMRVMKRRLREAPRNRREKFTASSGCELRGQL